jgi:hypothetical protein
MNEELLTYKHDNKTIFSKIMEHLTDDTELIKTIIECKYATPITIPQEFVSYCVTHYPAVINMMINKKIIANPIKILPQLSNDEQILDILQNNKDLVKKEYEILYNLVKKKECYLEYILNNNMLNDELFNIFLSNGVFHITKHLSYTLKRSSIEQLIKNLTPQILNNCHITSGTILNNVHSYDDLMLLLTTRIDFDSSLLFYKTSDGINLLIRSCLEGDQQRLDYLLGHESFTYDEYTHALNYAKHIFTKIIVVDRFLTCKHSDEKLLCAEFSQNYNLMHYAIENKHPLEIIEKIINHPKMNNNILFHLDEKNNNILFNALKYKHGVDQIVNSKNFSPTLLEKHILELILENNNTDLLILYLSCYYICRVIRNLNRKYRQNVKR